MTCVSNHRLCTDWSLPPPSFGIPVALAGVPSPSLDFDGVPFPREGTLLQAREQRRIAWKKSGIDTGRGGRRGAAWKEQRTCEVVHAPELSVGGRERRNR